MSEAPSLHDRLLEAAADLVDAEGPDKLTLRSLATRAGVSRQAPYLCFRSKDELLARLAERGLTLEAAWAEDAPEAPASADADLGDGAARMRALTNAHLRLRREHPGLYLLAHGRIDKAATPELHELAAAAFRRVREAVVAMCPDADLETARERVMIAWALTRGAGELAGMASTPASVPGDAAQWAASGLASLVRAWRAEDATP